jgi:hypothetical protein
MNRSGLRLLLAMAIAVAGSFIGPRAWSQQALLPKFGPAVQTPNGCVDCHKVAAGADTRLNVQLAARKHIDISAIVRSVPDGCIMCHREGVQAGPLRLQTHRIHYVNSQPAQFVPPFQASCLVCHAVDAAGAAKVKIGPKNW